MKSVMNMEQMFFLLAGILLAAILIWEWSVGFPNLKRTTITSETMKVGLNNPKLWIFYDTSDVNSRHWYDFTGRSSNAINVPLYNILYERIAYHNGKQYNIEVLGGLEAVAARMGGWNALPTSLQNPKARVNKIEYDWIRTAILAKYGGLWLCPSVISINPIGPLPNDRVVVFENTPTPGFRSIWSPYPQHPLFVKWETMIRERLDKQLGGYNFRNDSANDWNELMTNNNELVDSKAEYELSRNIKNNKELQLEDIFASGTEGRLTFQIPNETKYIVIPKHDLFDREMWGWLLRTSEQQFLESDLAITHIIQKYPIQN